MEEEKNIEIKKENSTKKILKFITLLCILVFPLISFIMNSKSMLTFYTFLIFSLIFFVLGITNIFLKNFWLVYVILPFILAFIFFILHSFALPGQPPFLT